MENIYMIIDKMEASVEYTAAEQLLVDKLHSSTLSHQEIWDGSVTDAGVVRARRDELKTKIKARLIEIQAGYCIYCGRSFEFVCGERGNKKIQRDHIAPKSLYKKFTFEVNNLVLACDVCNCDDYKGSFDTIEVYDVEYDKCTFNIIHPYYDKWSDHLQLNDDGSISLYNGSLKGSKTKKLFGLDEMYQLELRKLTIELKKHRINALFEAAINKTVQENSTSAF